MSIRACFTGKIAAGKVAAGAGAKILDTLDEVMRERHGKHAAMLAAAIAKGEAAIPNFQPDYNVCPTDPADVVVPNEGARDLVRMRWGLVPYWWSKPLKELRLATFNARVETVTTKPFFREPFKQKRCLMPVSGYYEWQDTPSGKQRTTSPRAMRRGHVTSSYIDFITKP